MAVLFFLSFYLPDWFRYKHLLRAFSEAALVGALADWFAVTALFRHPLGIPIPHTAIVPTNQARIGKNLGTFIETNFLSPDVLHKDLVDISGLVATWLNIQSNRNFLVNRFQQAIPLLSSLVTDERVAGLIGRAAKSELRSIPPARALLRLLKLARDTPGHQEMLDEVLRMIAAFLDESQGWLRNTLGQASPWFVPQFVDQRVFDAMLQKAEDTLTAALNDRQHELRQHIDASYNKFLSRLSSSSRLSDSIEGLRNELLDNQLVTSYLGNFAGRILTALTREINTDRSYLVDAIHRVLDDLAKLLLQDEALRRKANNTIQRIVVSIIESHRDSIADRIADVVGSWDSSSLVKRIESHIGADLQFIRINGTVVGGLVGLGIYGCKLLLE